MKNALELRGYTVAVFKKKYPRLYKKIIGIYGGRIAVVDPQAAVCLYLNHEARPVCSVCNIPLTITKKCRMPQVKHRCSLHVNIKDIITIETLAANNTSFYHNYLLCINCYILCSFTHSGVNICFKLV